MTNRLGLAIVVLLIVALVALVAWRDALAQQAQVRCVDGFCMVPQAMLIELVQKADLAEEYARLCRWAK